MKLILFNSFKNNKLNCNCKLFCCCRVGSCLSNPTPKLTENHYENNYKHEYMIPFIDMFNENKDVYEICITVKPQILDCNYHTIRPDLFKSHKLYTVQLRHQDIMNKVEKIMIRFLKKHNINPKVLVITEYSENCRLHWHGIIAKPFSPEMAQLLMNILNRNIGRTIIKKVNSKNYFEYIEKDTGKNYETIKNCFTIN